MCAHTQRWVVAHRDRKEEQIPKWTSNYKKFDKEKWQASRKSRQNNRGGMMKSQKEESTVLPVVIGSPQTIAQHSVHPVGSVANHLRHWTADRRTGHGEKYKRDG